MTRKKRFHLLPLAALVVAMRGHAFGIDKLSIDLDASKGFKSVGTFVVFNDDSKGPVFVTAQALTWDMSRQGEVTTEPSRDIEIFPSVQKVEPGGTGAFKVRYSGPAIERREGDYRVLFSQIKLPSGEPSQEGSLSKVAEDVNAGMKVGLAMTLPVYVSDFSVNSNVLDQVVATFKPAEHGVTVVVTNKGDRHVIISGVRVNHEARPGMGPVLAGKVRDLRIESTDPVTSVALELSYRGKSKLITATGGE